MEAGYDYILVQSRQQHRMIRLAALYSFGIGVIMVAASVIYYYYA